MTGVGGRHGNCPDHQFTQPHWLEAGSRGLARPGVLARGCTASTAVTIDKNQRLRCSNSALLHELAHMRMQAQQHLLGEEPAMFNAQNSD
jgi:hypothetical protein